MGNQGNIAKEQRGKRYVFLYMYFAMIFIFEKESSTFNRETHVALKERMNPWPEWIRRFLLCTMIQTDLESKILIQISQRNAA